MNAAETYAARRRDIAQLMRVLEEELARTDAAHTARPGDWGLPGSLGKIREDLMNTVSFISGKHARAIENQIAN